MPSVVSGQVRLPAITAADAEYADTIAIHERLGAQVVRSRAEGLGIEVGRDGISRLALALAPERLVDGQADEALVAGWDDPGKSASCAPTRRNSVKSQGSLAVVLEAGPRCTDG